MNANTTLEKIRNLALSKMMELRPFASEEMNLLNTNEHREGFIEGERALATQVLELIDAAAHDENIEPVEEEMVMSLGRT